MSSHFANPALLISLVSLSAQSKPENKIEMMNTSFPQYPDKETVNKTNLPISYKALTRKLRIPARPDWGLWGNCGGAGPTLPHCQLRETDGDVSHWHLSWGILIICKSSPLMFPAVSFRAQVTSYLRILPRQHPSFWYVHLFPSPVKFSHSIFRPHPTLLPGIILLLLCP